MGNRSIAIYQSGADALLTGVMDPQTSRRSSDGLEADPPDDLLTEYDDTHGSEMTAFFGGKAVKQGKDKSSMEVQQHSTSNSYLVRVWQETGKDTGLRFYLRDLKTGAERYLGDQEQISEILTRGLEPVEDTGKARHKETA